MQRRLAAAENGHAELQRTADAGHARLLAERAQIESQLAQAIRSLAETERNLRESAAANERSGIERADMERKITEVDDARHQLGEALAQSEANVKNIETKLAEVTRDAGENAGRHTDEVAGLRDALESSLRETGELRAKADAAAEDFRMRLLALESHVDAVSSERHRLEDERDANARAHAAAQEEAGKIAAARDESLAKAEAERARHAHELAQAEVERVRLAQELAEEQRKKADELDSARIAIATLERENAEAKAAHDAAARQRDELARRLTRIADEQKRLIENFADPQTADPVQRSVRPATIVKQHVVEMTDADILPPQRDRPINLPPARPMHVTPPKVRTL